MDEVSKSDSINDVVDDVVNQVVDNSVKSPKKSHKGLIIGLVVCGVLFLCWSVGYVRNVANESDVAPILHGDSFNGASEYQSFGSSFSDQSQSSSNGSDYISDTSVGVPESENVHPVVSSDFTFDTESVLAHDVSLGLSSVEFDNATANLDTYLSDADFIVETDKTSTITLNSSGVVRSERVVVGRIASDKLSSFLAGINSDSLFKIVSRNISTQNISTSYDDIDKDIESLQSQLDDYREKAEKAETDLDKRRFEDVQESLQEQIDALNESRADLDDQVQFTSVFIDLMEDVSYSNSSAHQSVVALQNKFKALPDQMFVICGNIVLGLIYLLPWFGIAFVLWLIGRYLMTRFGKSDTTGGNKS